ncbi:dimethyl sulfoxide reductase anchor subunit family protein [Candidatus Halocynthiibacter alkanivorans]|uniref:dimethyl sulfoxide reductase anchor subunit family protein n=1 Tax=Candidatus Halocynthiibacter alkanivorans TaxID=2267619 RepID=UPI000DF42015|nr:DmsC/YnfH family molybdoenzyme membrane anchor subunit [Candidatus Halocynthiibacter alkanivorans]
MHPAPSVIIFTALSGLGFGLLTWLGFGFPEVSGATAFAMFFVAFALAAGGLLASTFHLGNPQRALKAFSQWRSSWLSREAVLAVASLGVMGLYAIGLIFLNSTWQLLGGIGGALSITTVFSTSMIYAQMKTVPRWRMPLTPVLFLTYALGGGALLAGQVLTASLLLLALSVLQLISWKLGDRRFAQAGSTIETATGLGFLGRVRLLEKPHSGSNYLMREMVHVVGRKHALKLRGIALLTLGIIPAALLLVLPFNHIIAVAAVASHLLGLFAARWLFFAEAEHVVGLYYDQRRVG